MTRTLKIETTAQVLGSSSKHRADGKKGRDARLYHDEAGLRGWNGSDGPRAHYYRAMRVIFPMFRLRIPICGAEASRHQSVAGFCRESGSVLARVQEPAELICLRFFRGSRDTRVSIRSDGSWDDMQIVRPRPANSTRLDSLAACRHFLPYSTLRSPLISSSFLQHKSPLFKRGDA